MNVANKVTATLHEKDVHMQSNGIIYGTHNNSNIISRHHRTASEQETLLLVTPGHVPFAHVRLMKGIIYASLV